MGFFDFLADNPRYADSRLALNRLNQRHRFIVEAYANEISGARVLDLACHDGRWSYALAAAGAREVLGIEGRPELLEEFTAYPDDEAKARVRLQTGDVFGAMEQLAAAGETFDVVAIYGLYYHVMDHYRLLQLAAALGPRLILIDSVFLNRPQPLIKLAVEATDDKFNAIAQRDGQALAPFGIPSPSAVDLMATSLGYATTWADWSSLPSGRRGGLKEYFDRDRPKYRDTVALRRG
jgi:hypothetical protein